MPRVGGGGGPLVPPQAPGAQGPQSTQQTQKSDFASKVQAPTQGTESARTQQTKHARQSQLTGKAREIARRLQAGDIDQKEATREFVGLVIEERFPQFKKRKRKKGRGDEEQSPEEQLEEAVTELIDQDPVLARRLSEQFRKMASKG